MITKYGYITAGIFVSIALIVFIFSQFIGNNYIKITLSVLSVLLFLFTLYFFRDPDRNTPNLDNVVISPADGKVLIVKKVESNDFVKGEAWQVSIFMSPFNVHVNRIPINGIVKLVRYVKGNFLVAFHDKADERNERSEFGIESKYGNVFFTQVAGFVARRIVYDIQQGDTVEMGKRFGMIKFGSRVDIVVSTDWDLKVKDNDVVTAGESIIFEFNKNESKNQ
ncbi:Phosphatidylserine decarboxylase [hydrothermal vent metagenome]|uniref:Phosphatidylserine decarboxylase n=1 Tax=hydrothermal vent metagenome TaxID=652676 RepID=A0A3B1C774_9ZZZZ